MANTLLTIGGITRKAIAIFRNSNAFLQAIDRQYDDQFGKSGGKIGNTLRIRLPNDYTVRTGATAVPQNTTETQVTLTVGTQQGVDTSFTSADLALSIDDFADRILKPMVNVLAAGVAQNVMQGVEQIPNFVHAVSGSATVTPTAATWLAAGAILDQYAAPRGERTVIIDPMTMSRTVSTLSGLFNSQEKVGNQYKRGLLGTETLGFDWLMDQTVILHTEGAFTTGTVNGANQTGSTLTVGALGAALKAGDIITIAGVNSVNRVTKQDSGLLQQFVVLANAAGGATSISIYPSLNPQVTGANVAYQTVVASPANSAVISTPVAANEVYRKNIAFAPGACTLVTADLPLPTGAVQATAREQYDGISLRMIQDYNSTTDAWLSRLDILYGWAWPRPEWAVIVADAV